MDMQTLLSLEKVNQLRLEDAEREAVLAFFASREEALNLSDSFTTPKLLTLCDGLELACDKLRMNANVRLTLTAFAVENGLL